MTETAALVVDRVDSSADAATVAGLAEILIDSVHGGASVGWTEPPTVEEATAWWQGQLADGDNVIWAARQGSRVIGTVMLQLARKKNGLHRAEVAKLMVHREGRGLGISSRLMAALEGYAREDGRTLLLLDTETGSLAESLYAKWGWEVYGRVPGYTRRADGTEGGTTFFLKRLG